MRAQVLLFILFTSFSTVLFGQEEVNCRVNLFNNEGKPLPNIAVYLNDGDEIKMSNQKGGAHFILSSNKSYSIQVQGINIFRNETRFVSRNDTLIEFQLEERLVELKEVEVFEEIDPNGIRRLKPLESGGLYEGKKTAVINLKKVDANLAQNNARQALAKIPSLNIWESDNGGLQLDIGGRGLSPKRTANFNTRQNSYDISADALGYPESYYSPPLDGVSKIELVRGAGALQYGSQFGGLINFKMKSGNPKKRLSFKSNNTIGSNQFISSFNSLGGQFKKLNYYTFWQEKKGNSWRENSKFNQQNGFLSLHYQFNPKILLRLEISHMNYLSQQSGGLTDSMFLFNPKSSNRNRNWFKVNWNLGAFLLEWDLGKNLKLFNRTFALDASRTSLGILETPDLADPMSNRDLILGEFKNIGNETRLSYSYNLKNGLQNSVLVGIRVYRGKTNFSQGYGTSGSDPNFNSVDTSFLKRKQSNFNFPSLNIALFGEKIIRLNEFTSLIPGFRFESIDTRSNGYFTNSQRINSFGDFIESKKTETNRHHRNVFLYGLGFSKKIKTQFEFYSNLTANYRAINFTDIQIQSNIQIVDPNIKDENGYSFDFGIRNLNGSKVSSEISLFYIKYHDKIGEVIDDGLRLRTNIGTANIFGVEYFLEMNLLSIAKKESKNRLSCFLNAAYNYGAYARINSKALVGVKTGNRLEDIPEYNIKTGVSYSSNSLSCTFQSTFIGQQYSDAANTIIPYKGVFGPIPSFIVSDLSINWNVFKHLSISSSVNNLFDQIYFTRRASAYPGPGIIPANGRNFSFSLIATI